MARQQLPFCSINNMTMLIVIDLFIGKTQNFIRLLSQSPFDLLPHILFARLIAMLIAAQQAQFDPCNCLTCSFARYHVRNDSIRHCDDMYIICHCFENTIPFYCCCLLQRHTRNFKKKDVNKVVCDNSFEICIILHYYYQYYIGHPAQ